jgi:multidrug transporter EmrE-like cation transporter
MLFDAILCGLTPAAAGLPDDVAAGIDAQRYAVAPIAPASPPRGFPVSSARHRVASVNAPATGAPLSATLILGLGLALASAAASNLGFLMRHRGAVAAPDVDVRHLLRSAVGLFRSKWWAIGYAVAVVAYLFHVGALALAPLSLVQAVLSAGIVLLGIFAERLFGHELGRREWTGLLLVAVGLTFLAVTGGAKDGQETADYSVPAMVAFESGLVAIGVALILSCRSSRVRAREGVLLGVAAGLLFTVTHVAVKAASGKVDTSAIELLANPYLALALAGGIAAFFASARSLQIGPAVPVIAVTSIAGNASAIPAGIVVFGDPLGDDTLIVVLRTLAFLLVTVAAAAIPAPLRAAPQEESQAEPAEAPSPPEPRREPALRLQ